MADAKFDLKLIPEFNGSTSVVDWIARVKQSCHLRGVNQFELVILLQLTEAALDVYQLLSDNEKAALYKAFAIDPCIAYKRFTSQTLMAGESVDVFFAALKKLVVLFRGFYLNSILYTCLWLDSRLRWNNYWGDPRA